MEAAAAAYRELCSVEIAEAPGGDGLAITIKTEPWGPSDVERVVDEFLNYALDLSLSAHLGIGGDGPGSG